MVFKKLFGKQDQPELLGIGDEAPDFSLRDHRGRTVGLSEFRGRKLLIWFYPKADTPG